MLPKMSARFLLASVGSDGDLLPVRALALRLRARGHDVRVCASPSGASLFEERGLDFHPLGIDMRDLLVRSAREARDSPVATFRTLLRLLRDGLGEQIDTLRELSRDRDALVGAGAVFGGATAAEAAGIPWRAVLLTPQLLASRHHPPPGITWQRLPGWVNAAAWWGERAVLNALTLPVLNAARARHGLRPVPDLHAHFAPPGRVLVATDPDLCPAPPDRDPGVVQTGSWEEPIQGDLPGEVRAFLEDGPAVYLGFGSMPDPDPGGTTALLARAVERAGLRALIGAGWAGLGEGALPPSCLRIGRIPHAVLFPRLLAVVHHGGSGTTAAAARSGVPQLAIPHLLDQFWFGDRIARAGLGPLPIRRRRLTPARLATALRALVQDPRHREAAAVLAARMRGRDGVGATVEVLEELVPGADP